MFNFLKRQKDPEPSQATPQEGGFFSRISAGMAKTRARFTEGLAGVFLGEKNLNLHVIELIETHLISADVGLDATQSLIANLTQKLARKELNDTEAAIKTLQLEMQTLLQACQLPLNIEDKKPFVILIVGINGSGKTTTIGKLAQFYQSQGKKVLLAAGDTFRAAATEQLQVWGERNNIAVIAQQPGADPAAVIFDAIAAAKARDIDIVLADTAGRLHTQSHLMEELKKIKRVMAKVDSSAPHETLLVLDASIGQNALNQAQQFNEAIGVTGLALTKLDGTAKGGIVFAIAKQLNLPIRFIGVGEKIDDLRPFNAQEFVAALFTQ